MTERITTFCSVRRNFEERKNVKQSKVVLACWGPIINKGETNFILQLGWEK